MPNENILIAEDDGIIAARLQSILVKLGYAVPAMVASGEDAIQQAAETQPELVLMDEPLSNLDAKLRTQMRGEVIKLQKRLETTLVYVTHDQEEALTMSDRIAVMSFGRSLSTAPSKVAS